MNAVVLLLGLAVASQAVPRTSLNTLSPSASVDDLFEGFKQKYDKLYKDGAEHRYRKQVFQQNLERAQQYNKEEGDEVFGITKFSDLTPDEFKLRYLRYVAKGNSRTKFVDRTALKKSDNTSVDWMAAGAASPVKDQGQCGSCWAFSCVEQIESDTFLQTGSLYTLAPQQVVSCDKTDGGCDGGDTPTCYDYVVSAGGLQKEATYPYKSGDTGRDGTCHSDKSKQVVTIEDFKYVSKNGKDEDAMVDYLSATGPLSICVDAETWQTYSSGIIKRSCRQDLDHCVQITGYNMEGDVHYWVIRNSWNTDWGQDGFIYVEMGKNLCGVAEEATYTTGSKIL